MAQETPATTPGLRLQETYDKLSQACLTNAILVEHPNLLLLTYNSDLKVQDVLIPGNRMSLHFDMLYEHPYNPEEKDPAAIEEMQNQIISLASTESNALLLTYLLQNSEMANTVVLGKTFEAVLPDLKDVKNIIMSDAQFRKHTNSFTDVSETTPGQISRAGYGEIAIFGLPDVYNPYVGNKIIFTNAPNQVGLFKRVMQLNTTRETGIITISQGIATRNRAATLTMILPAE